MPNIHNFLYIKAPLIFPAAYNLVKPFLSEDTKNKVKILGGKILFIVILSSEIAELPKKWGEGGYIIDWYGKRVCVCFRDGAGVGGKE